MLLVVDANKIFSSLLTGGKTFEIFLGNKLLNKFQFSAPEFLFFEIGKHFDEIVDRSKLERSELSTVFKFLREEIEFVPLSEFDNFAKEALKLAPHPKDVQYFALALYLNCPIWSNEKSFIKQSLVRICANPELLKELGIK